jgi:uncharacterized membrane protein
MTQTFSIEVDIAAPAERVWKVMTDVERWPEWTASVKSIRLLDKKPFGVGSRALVRQPRLLPAIWKVTRVEPNRSFTWETGMPGLFSAVGGHALEENANGCHITLSVTFTGVLGGVMAHLTKDLNGRYLALESQGLKRRTETGR